MSLDKTGVWQRIEAHSGEAFQQIRGASFTYEVVGSHVVPDRTVQRIPKSHFAKALDLLPISGPGEIQQLRGPSYIYAILMDGRIRQGEW
jgi:hypothetical protein